MCTYINKHAQKRRSILIRFLAQTKVTATTQVVSQVKARKNAHPPSLIARSILKNKLRITARCTGGSQKYFFALFSLLP